MKISIITTAISLMAFLWPLASSAQVTVDETFSGVDEIEVKGSFANVEVNGSQRKDVHLTGELMVSKKNEDDYKIRYEKNGDKLEVWIEKPSRNWSWNSNNKPSVIRLEVPVKTEVEVDNSSGNVKVTYIKADVSLEASSGNIDVSDIEGRLNIEASSGNIYISNVEGHVASETSSGRQSLNDINGKVKAEASSGNILLTDVKGTLSLKTSSGDIKLVEVDGNLTAGSTSGDITGNDVKLTGSNEFKSTSGSIRMDMTNNMDDVHFDLHATSGSIRAGSSEGKRDLVINSRGKVKVYGKSTSGSQRYF